MAQLDTLRPLGWSYRVGYSHDYKGFVAMAWKPREKVVHVPAPGGGKVALFTFCVSAMGDNCEAAALACYKRATTECTEGKWWDGLPVTRVNC